jgi:chemotaxis protein CheD
MDIKIIEVSTGQIKICKGNATLKASAIGSCVVIAVLGLSSEPMGIMAHVMLAGKSPMRENFQRTKYAVDAIDIIVKIIKHKNIGIDYTKVFIAGGGNVLKKPDDIICASNILSVKRLLTQKGFKITASAVGGINRRSISLDVANGNVWYTEGNGKAKLLWSEKAGK